MTTNQKEWFQYSCAAFMLLTGALLSFISFFMQGDVTNNILFYVGECIMFAGGIFGVTIYFNTKGKQLTKDVRNEIIGLIKGNKNETSTKENS